MLSVLPGRLGEGYFDKLQCGAMEQDPLVICTRYLLPLEAEIFAARLQADGIEAVVIDSNIVYANGAFHTSLGMGGVRVMVPASQLAEAQRVLAAYNAGEYAIDESFDPNP